MFVIYFNNIGYLVLTPQPPPPPTTPKMTFVLALVFRTIRFSRPPAPGILHIRTVYNDGVFDARGPRCPCQGVAAFFDFFFFCPPWCSAITSKQSVRRFHREVSNGFGCEICRDAGDTFWKVRGVGGATSAFVVNRVPIKGHYGAWCPLGRGGSFF